VSGVHIDCSRISKHGEGLAKPKGIKVKEKTTKGASRPIGGFEKQPERRKKTWIILYRCSQRLSQRYKISSLFTIIFLIVLAFIYHFLGSFGESNS
jgi:hypothetical protein